MNMLNNDICNCITALEYYITDFEESLSEARNFGAGDREWERVETYKETLTNLKLLRSIYGKI